MQGRCEEQLSREVNKTMSILQGFYIGDDSEEQGKATNKKIDVVLNFFEFLLNTFKDLDNTDYQFDLFTTPEFGRGAAVLRDVEIVGVSGSIEATLSCSIEVLNKIQDQTGGLSYNMSLSSFVLQRIAKFAKKHNLSYTSSIRVRDSKSSFITLRFNGVKNE
jgi:hypothetical protein